jgi:FkbM family methyltransferase
MEVNHPFWGMTKDWGQLWEALEVARAHSAVGTEAPPLTRLARLARPLARLAARALLVAARPFTRPQRHFNAALLDAVEALGARLLALEAGEGGGPAVRTGTLDAWVWRMVAVANEYRLPDRFGPDDLVLDVGAHIGSFSHAVLARGAGHVHACEADPANAALLARNLRAFPGRHTVHRLAVWRSDRIEDRLCLGRSDVTANTGGNSVLHGHGTEVPARPLDELLLEATGGGRRRVRLAKFDCEGSEWPILFTARRLGLLDALCGEYHELPQVPEAARVAGLARCEAAALARLLEGEGFVARLAPVVPGVVGHFWAERPGAGPAVFPHLFTSARWAA